MTKNHFIAIAAILAKQPKSERTRVIANDLATYFETENPNFDAERFLDACGIN